MTINLEDFHIIELAKNDSNPIKHVRWITGTRYNFALSEDSAFKDHAQFRDWCLEHCTGKVVFVEKESWGGENPTTIIFFYYEEDAVLAKLTWFS